MLFRNANLILSLFALLVMLAPDAAFAAGAGTLACSGGGPSGGSLLGNSCSGSMALNTLFSGLICNYKLIIDQVLSALFCGISYVFTPVVGACLSLAVVIFGIKMTLGIVQFREGFMVIIKLGFVSYFALNASATIGIGYNFFNSLMEEGMAWVISAVLPVSVSPGSGASTVFGAVDQIFFNILTSPTSASGAKLFAFIALLGQVLAPLFGMTIYFWGKSLLIFIRAVLTYLLAINAIAFLFALSPMFLSFAMFKSTYTFFDSWLKHIASFVLQVILIFAALSIWIMLMAYLGDFFVQLSDAIFVDREAWQRTQEIDPTDTWGLCANYGVGAGAFGPTLSCGGGGGGQPIHPTALVTHPKFMYFFVVNLVTLILAAYAFDTIMRQVPEIAKQLSGPKSVSAIGSGFPGFDKMEQNFENAVTKHMTQSQSNASKFLQAARGGGKKDAAADKDAASGKKDPNAGAGFQSLTNIMGTKAKGLTGSRK